MTALLPANDVVEASRDDLLEAFDNGLRLAGMTFDELADQARRGQFETVQARMAWVAIGDLSGLRD